MPPQSRSVLRSRRDLPQRVQALLESFGPADLALAAPEEPELPWTGLEGREETAARPAAPADAPAPIVEPAQAAPQPTPFVRPARETARSEEHTSELQSLMRISYAVFCLKKKKKQ